MDDATKELVRCRAELRCEYCRIRQSYFVEFFQIEHIIAKSHGGSSEVDNLALACRQCNLHKGPNLTGIDPESQRLTRLFNPRADNWCKHFEIAEGEICGKTDIGRTTVYVLNMNTFHRIQIRLLENRIRHVPDQIE